MAELSTEPPQDIRESVRERYAAAARTVAEPSASSSLLRFDRARGSR